MSKYVVEGEKLDKYIDLHTKQYEKHEGKLPLVAAKAYGAAKALIMLRDSIQPLTQAQDRAGDEDILLVHKWLWRHAAVLLSESGYCPGKCDEGETIDGLPQPQYRYCENPPDGFILIDEQDMCARCWSAYVELIKPIEAKEQLLLTAEQEQEGGE